MISTLDIHWTAGFLEGEACFSCLGNSACIKVSQVQKEPLDKLVALYGGKLRHTEHRKNYFVWQWELPVNRSIQVMMTLYPLMSSKRKSQIEACIKKWMAAKPARPHGSNMCLKGHLIEGNNAIVSKNGHTRCRKCKNDYMAARRHGSI